MGLLQGFATKILLKQGTHWLQQLTGTAVRHGVAIYGAKLLASGLASNSQIEAIGGGLMAVSAIACSYFGGKLGAALK